MMKFKKSIAFLITLAMFMTFALPVFAEVIPEATAEPPVYVFTDTNGDPLKLANDCFPVSVGKPSKVQIKKDGVTIDLGTIAETVISSDTAVVTIGADGNNTNTFVITPIANGETTITYTNGDDTAELKVIVGEASSEDPEYQFVLANGLTDIPNNEFTYSHGAIPFKIRKADGSFVNNFHLDMSDPAKSNVKTGGRDTISIHPIYKNGQPSTNTFEIGASGIGGDADTVTYTDADGKTAVLKVTSIIAEGFYWLNCDLLKEFAIRTSNGGFTPFQFMTKDATGQNFHPEQADLNYNTDNLTVVATTKGVDGFTGVTVTPKNNIGGTLTYSKNGLEF